MDFLLATTTRRASQPFYVDHSLPGEGQWFAVNRGRTIDSLGPPDVQTLLLDKIE